MRYLFGPVGCDFAEQTLAPQRARGDCLTFRPDGAVDLVVGPDETWEAVCARLPPAWRPDFVALWLPYAFVPPCLWSAPVALVGLAADWHLLFHPYRRRLAHVDLVLTDAVGVETLGRAGLGHTMQANLFGCERAFLDMPEPDGPRDIDVLFVGRLNPAVQRDRLPWLARLACLGERYRVQIHTEVFGDDYRALLRRARVVFNRAVRGECNLRAFEAAAAGALLFQEAGNRELHDYFADRRACVCYTEDDLEPLLQHYLDHEDERAALAETARQKVRGCSFSALWEGTLGRLEACWPEVSARARRRLEVPAPADLGARVWQALGAGRPLDAGLVGALTAALAAAPHEAALHNALGLAAALETREAGAVAQARAALDDFRRAVDCDNGHAIAGLNLAEALALAGQRDGAAEQARRTLTALERRAGLAPAALEAGHFPPAYDLFRVEWERAAWQHAGRPEAEARAKRDLVRWRLHLLLGDLTGAASHYHEAVAARPDLPVSQAALGCALAGAGRPAEGVPHLRAALAGNPFDLPAARALFGALGAANDAEGQRRLARDRRRLSAAAPRVVPPEPWFAEAIPVGDELASLVILCCNQLEFTRQSLESVLRHTRPPYELVLVDNGSTDDTPAYLEEIARRAGPERVTVLRNEANRGFAAGCNQGLAEARGAYLVLLNNDTIVTADWLDGLVDWVLRDWPAVGMVGPVTSWAAAPQMIEVDYRKPEGLDAFAARRRRDYRGQALRTDRLIGFCLLARREVLQAVGGLDEGFGLGFFEDDDLCLRVRAKGLRLLIAQDVFVHHYGGRTFAGLEIDAHKQLKENFELFKGKWGAERAAGYRLPDPEPSAAVLARPKVSLCTIVKNEESHLADCLHSVAGLVDEMIVVDTGSTDRTQDIARACGARVFDFAWVDSFAAARNESLRHASGAWILWLDADEHLDEANRDRLRRLLGRLGDANVCYLMRQRSPLEAAAHAATAVDQVRLFRNRPDVRWSYRVHEQILPAIRRAGGSVVQTDIVIEHVGFADPTLQGPKLDRNLRLLELELAENPDDPFVLYNLGAVALSAGRHDEAVAHLRRSLMLSGPGDSTARKLHTLIARAHHEAGRKDEALAACRAGRAAFPDDPELLFWEGLLLEERGDLAGAEACLLCVLDSAPGHHFMSFDAGLRGYRTRHFLAGLYCRQGRMAAAEAQWRAAVAERLDFTPGWQALAELLLEQRRWPELEAVLPPLAADPRSARPAALLWARALLARREFAEARGLLSELIARDPGALPARVLLSHALLQEGADPAGAERALRYVLALAPGNAEAEHNLALLLRQRQEGAPAPTAVVGAAPAADRPKVSLCMIVRNEESNLPACLGSVADLVDEVIVVDTGSTDATKAVAVRFGAKVYDFPWVDDFAAARNESLRHATGEWTFWMDADDRLDEDSRTRLRTLFAGLGDENAGYVMQCLCLPDPVTQTATTVDHLRLFRNRPTMRWCYRVHEQILPAVRRHGGEVRWSGVVVQHTGYQDPALRRRKLERDLRLLRLDLAEKPNEPFTLFNLGQVAQEQGRLAEALACFRRSLAGSQPADSITRKLYALIAQCHNHLSQREQALTVCREGRGLFPEDVELTFQEGVILRSLGDRTGAEACWRAALASAPPAYFGSMPAGLRGHLTRHNLAGLLRETGREAEAEAQWRAALAERPDYEPAWRGLSDLLLAQRRWQEAEALAAGLEGGPEEAVRAASVRGRGHLARREFAAGRHLLEGVSGRFPQAVEPRLLLGYVLLQEGEDWEAAERALREVLTLDPAHAEARHNLSVLLTQQGRQVDLPALPLPSLAELYRAACATPSDIHAHCPTLRALAAEGCHVTEMGTRTGVSTTALLAAQPAKLVCYDKVRHAQVDVLQAAAGRTEFVFHQADVLAIEIEATDLLLLDTWHVYEQLEEELRLHAGKVRKYIVLHDTTTFGEYGEAPGHRGLWPAVEEFLERGTFRLKERWHHNNGLTVLEAVKR